MGNRSRRGFLWMTVGSGVTGYALLNRQESHRRFARIRNAFGATTKIVVWHDEASEAEAALKEGFAVIESIEASMSLYRNDSQLCRLNSDGFLKDPGEDLVRVLSYAQRLSALTEGAFDVTVQPLWRSRQNECSAEALDLVDWESLRVTPSEIRFVRPKMQVTLNGIAQGYAADRVREVLQGFGVRHALIDTGEHCALGRLEGAPWKMAVQHPRDSSGSCAELCLADRCLATSGDYATAFDDTLTAHHLVDPHTGNSPSELASVSIAAPTGMEADALSTAVFVLGIEKGARLIRSTPGVDGLLVPKDGSAILMTPGFPRQVFV